MGERSDTEESSGDESQRQAPQRRETIPDAVDHFLGQLLTGLQTRNIPDIHKLYEDTYNKLSDKHYKTSRWPSVEAVKEQVSSEPLFLILYQELYYRHLFSSRIVPTHDDRKRSWENYCKLLDLVVDDLASGEDLSLALPPQWVWDILDEFIYNYQIYCNFRNKAVKIQKEKEIQEIKDNPDVFATPKVLNYMNQLIRTSRIDEYLANPENPKGVTGSSFTDETTRLFGYFGLMQLLRMHSLLGDYRLAMQTIDHIDFDAEVPLFYKIPACHVSLYYYMGFAYVMLRRYVDAIRTFSDILTFLHKTTGINEMSYQYSQMVKKQDQMNALLLICVSLSPRPIDESLEKPIRDKHGDKQARLQQGEELCFEELFSYACPKFVSAALPDFDTPENFNPNEAHQRQLRLFLQEVKEQQFLPRIGSYMKLYTAIKTSKLAQLCEMDEEGLRDQLMCVMHKTRQAVRTKGAPLEGDPQQCGEVDFYLDGDMVHINAHRVERPHSEVFLEQILKFQDLLRKMGKA